MKLLTVHFSALVNTGSYENERVGLDAQVEDGETAEQVTEALKEQVFALLDRSDKLQARRELLWEIRELEDKVAEARANWEKTAEFLRAQGIRPDTPEMPIPGLKRLTATEQVQVEVLDETENNQ